MNANELRIGNLINTISTNKVFESFITDVKGYDILRCEEKSFKYWSYEPIPLTEKWLSDFGFKKTNESEEVEWYSLNGFEIAIHEEDEKVYFVYQHMVLRHIINVHQLQNLYFAITGTELSYENEIK